MTDLADLVRRLREPWKFVGGGAFRREPTDTELEAADAISRLIELERRVKEAPSVEFPPEHRHQAVLPRPMTIGGKAARRLGLVGKCVRLLVVEEV